MKRAILIAWTLIALLAISARAAEPAAESKPDSAARGAKQATADPPEPVIPRRELKFDVSEEPHGVELKPDPKVLEQRYVAIIRVPLEDDSSYQVSNTLYHLSRGLKDSSFGPRGRPGPFQELLVADLPEERFPSKEIAAAFDAFVTGADRRMISWRKTDNAETRQTDGAYEIELLAPTAERAEELASGLIAFFDYRISYGGQREHLRQKQEFQEELSRQRTAFDKAQQEVAALEEQLEGLKGYADVTQDALNGLVTEQRLISVELAGVKARIEACKPHLRYPKHRDQVELIKITAEIELVGLAARRDCIQGIVEKVRRRHDLLVKVKNARNAASIVKNHSIPKLERSITDAEKRFKRYAPVRIHKVTIRRIKWESAKQTPPE